MQIVMKHEMKQIKNGWSARAPELGIAAHGYNEEVAKINLERGVRLFFQPFQRNGTLKSEVEEMGLKASGNANEEELTIKLE